MARNALKDATQFYDPNTGEGTPPSAAPAPAKPPGRPKATAKLDAEAPPKPVVDETAPEERRAEVKTEDERAAYLAEVARIREARNKRGTWGIPGQRLALPQRPGYKRYWFIDKPGRIELAKANGWAHIEDKQGAPKKIVTGSGRDGGAEYSYAMELPLEFWEEDQARVHQQAQERVGAIKKRPFRSASGQSDKSDQGKYYSPDEDKPVLQVEDSLRRAPAPK